MPTFFMLSSILELHLVRKPHKAKLQMPDINNIGTEENTIIPASEKEALAKKKEEFHKQEQSGDSYTQLVKKQFKKNKDRGCYLF